jgi:hypothetical protein
MVWRAVSDAALGLARARGRAYRIPDGDVMQLIGTARKPSAA